MNPKPLNPKPHVGFVLNGICQHKSRGGRRRVLDRSCTRIRFGRNVRTAKDRMGFPKLGVPHSGVQGNPTFLGLCRIFGTPNFEASGALSALQEIRAVG